MAWLYRITSELVIAHDRDAQALRHVELAEDDRHPGCLRSVAPPGRFPRCALLFQALGERA
jgi:DNA-directed RNA polymerase specialized sigma24 family protein